MCCGSLFPNRKLDVPAPGNHAMASRIPPQFWKPILTLIRRRLSHTTFSTDSGSATLPVLITGGGVVARDTRTYSSELVHRANESPVRDWGNLCPWSRHENC